MTSRRHISRGRKEGCRVKRLQLSLLILMACWSTRRHTCKSTHTYKYGVDEEALDVCIKSLACTQDCELSRAHTKMCRKWGEEALDVHKNISACVCECILPQTFKLNHINTHTHICWVRTRMYTLSHNMNMYSLTFGSGYTAKHADGAYCKAHRHLHTPSIACDRCWQEYCQEESSFISFYSLCILACLSLCSVAMSPKRFLFSSSSSVYGAFFFFLLCYHHEIGVICAKWD